MKVIRLLIPVFTGLVLCACTPASTQEGEEKQDPPVDPPSELVSPNLSVSGLPASAVMEGSSFNLTAKTKSNAPLVAKFNVAEEVAKATFYVKNCRVTLGDVEEDTPVVLTVSQEATDTYQAASTEVSFTILAKTEETPPPAPDPDPNLSGVRTVYEESLKDILNPERGLYSGGGDIRSASSPISVSQAKSARASGKTLMYVGFYLTKYMDGDIEQDYLDMIQASFDAMREAGIKCVLRFAYQSSENATPWDAPVEVVLRHVEQLKPLLQQNEDVIFVLQAGFVGVWGEWYYTTHFKMNPYKEEDFLPRRQLTDALLDAMPQSRQVALRTPEFKMRMYGLSVADTLTAATAHDGSVLSRLAGHNDCFGASANDRGTFDNVKSDRDFWKGDSRYIIMGGETCGLSDYCTCEASLKDMEDYHWTYLNSGYNTSVLNRWKTAGCYDEAVRRLGYRLVLLDSYRTENPKAGETFELAFRIQNRGFAAPQNPRNAILVFVDEQGNKSEFPLGTDPRTWHSGLNVVKCSFTLPSAQGTLYLNLSDPLLPDRPEYSIAFANTGVFDESTGYNKLLELR